jgi:cellulose synthase/poly-beta-1,6-N-acetylglucosamine synthase-like glycosyltransferase
LLLSVWVAYPVAIAGIAAVKRGTEPVQTGDGPTVSIIIATREAAGAISERVEDCLRADYADDLLDVVVALDRAGAATTKEELSLVGRVTVVDGDEPGGKAAALNAGVRASRGEVLVFTDTHQRFDRSAIAELVAAMADQRIGVASGSLELPAGDHTSSIAERYWSYERWLRRHEAKVHSTVGVTGAIFAVRHSLWAPLPSGLILDDVYTPMRAVLRGARVAFVERARAYETRRHTPLQEYRRKVRTLTGVVQLCRWLPAVLLPWRNPIWLQFLFHKLLRLLTPYCALAMAVWFVIVVTAALGRPFLAGLAVLVSITGVVIWSTRAAEKVGDSIWSLVAQGALLQAAVVVGTVNGLMGRWHVWRS